MTPTVAVVIPTHNRSDLLAITLRNLACQEGVDLQVAIVDDASTDDTEAVVAAFAHGKSNVGYERFPKPKGACAARNLGVSLTDAPLVCYLDSDDLMHPEKLARQAAQMAAMPELDAAMCQMAHFETDPNDAQFLWNTFQGNDYRRRFLEHDPVWGIHAPLWSRHFVEKIGGFDESLPMAQDYEFHLRALLHGANVLATPDLLTFCRRHSGPSIGGSKQLKRLEVLQGLFDKFRPNLQDDELHTLVGNCLWLANLGALLGDSGRFLESLARARAIAPKGLASFALWCRLALLTRKHRPYACARLAAAKLGHDLSKRESWHMSHHIADEPGIVRFTMPGSTWQ